MERKPLEELISRIAEKRKDALEEFYREYGKTIFCVALSVCKSKTDADEIVDDVLIKVWNSATSLKGVENLKAWLYRVTLNIAINKVKSRKKETALDERPVNEEGYKNVIDKATFYGMISDLSALEQQILCLKFIDDLIFEEIAEILGKPVATVAYKYYSALKKLSRQLKNF